MDAVDERLIALLRQDARRSLADLAAVLGLARANVRARLRRLEAAGDILGYTVVLRADAGEQAIRGITMVEIEGHATDRVIRVLAGLPEVTTIHSTNGRWDLVVEIQTPTLDALDAVLRRIRLVPGITRSDTSLLLSTQRTSRAQR